jgi:hypothetical protein
MGDRDSGKTRIFIIKHTRVALLQVKYGSLYNRIRVLINCTNIEDMSMGKANQPVILIFQQILELYLLNYEMQVYLICCFRTSLQGLLVVTIL